MYIKQALIWLLYGQIVQNSIAVHSRICQVFMFNRHGAPVNKRYPRNLTSCAVMYKLMAYPCLGLGLKNEGNLEYETYTLQG